MALQQKKRVFVLLTAIAFVWSILLPSFLSYGTANAAEDGPFGSKILICTTDGFKWVKTGETDQSPETPSKRDHGDCPFCLAFGKNIKDFAPVSGLKLVHLKPIKTTPHAVFEDQTTALPFFKESCEPRAPPQHS